MDNTSTSQLRSHLRYTMWNRIRYFYQKLRLGSLGDKVFIDKDVSILRFPKNIFIGKDVVLKKGANICSCNSTAIIRIGDRTTVGFYTFIYSSSEIEIGNDCLIAPFVYIVDSDHSIGREQLINKQQNKSSKIIIKDDVWISTGVKILKGVTIGKGAVIAAGSVVKEDVEPYAIVGGIPARKISERK